MNLKLAQRVAGERLIYYKFDAAIFFPALESEMKLQKRAELTVLRQRRAIGATWIEQESAQSLIYIKQL